METHRYKVKEQIEFGNQRINQNVTRNTDTYMKRNDMNDISYEEKKNSSSTVPLCINNYCIVFSCHYVPIKFKGKMQLEHF